MKNPPKNQYAFAMFELLVAMSLLAFLLLNFTAWQLLASRTTKQNYWQFIAMQQLENILSEIKAGNDNVNAWQQEVKNALPKGNLTYQNHQIKVNWQGEHQLSLLVGA